MKKTSRNSLIALLLLSASLIACGNNDTKKPTQTSGVENPVSDTVTVDEDALPEPEIPDELTFEGREFRILSGTYNDYCNITREESDGEVLNDAIRTMISNTESRFGITISEDTIGVYDTDSRLNTLVQTGDEVYNIMNNLDRFSVGSTINGYLRPLDDLEYVDLSKPWWNPDITSQLLVGDTHYLASSAASTLMYADTSSIWINTTMAGNYDINMATIYDDVRAGKWTQEMMMTYARYVTDDTSGDGDMTDADQYGLMSSDPNILGHAMICAGGGVTVENDGKGALVTHWEEPLFNDLVQNAHNIFFSNDTFRENPRLSGVIFNEGRALFMLSTFHVGVTEVETMKDDYTCVPLPKYDVEQDSYICPNYDIMLFCVPKFVNDTEFSGAVTEWMSYEGLKHVKDAYVESTMKGKKSISPEMREMVQLCLDSSSIDIGSLYTDTIVSYDKFYLNVFSDSSLKFSSYLAKNTKKLNARLETIMEAIEENKE